MIHLREVTMEYCVCRPLWNGTLATEYVISQEDNSPLTLYK